MKDGIRLSLFDGSAYAPQRDFPQEIVEKLINYIYVHLREKGYTEEGIIAFIKTIFPEDGISVEFNSDDELLHGIELARLTLKNNTELLSDWSPEEKSKILELIDNVLKISAESKEFLDLVHKVINETIQRIRNKEFYPKDSFSLPSHAGMFPILDLFSGRPQSIPRSVLMKPSSERTVEEENIASEFINSIAKSKTEGYDPSGNELITNYVVICDTSNNYATSDISALIKPDSKDLDIEYNLFYIQRAFGPEGLRHFLTILSKFGEQGTQNDLIKWNLNDHLERMGYQRKSHGSFDKREKDIAVEILRIFTSLNVCIYRKNKKKEELNVRQLFTIVGFDVTKDLSTQVSKGEIVIRADESWYSKPVEIIGEQPQFTNILRKILQVNHHHYPHAHFLSVLFALYWRIDLTGRKLKVSSLLNSCGISQKGVHAKLGLKNLEKELNYMKKEGYIGDWFNLTTPNKLPSSTKEPYSQVLCFNPPMWFRKSLEEVQINKQKHLDKAKIELPKEFKILSTDEFNEVFRQSKLSVSDFSDKIGVSRQTVSYLKSGSKPVSKDMSSKIWKVFPELFL